MKRGKPLERTRLKPGRRKPRVSLQGFWRAVTADGTSGCALAYLGGCAGPLDAHHGYAARMIRSEFATRIYNAHTWVEQKSLAAERDRALVDPRCGVPCCRQHHSEVEAGQTVCPRPPDLDGFLADYGLTERERAA